MFLHTIYFVEQYTPLTVNRTLAANLAGNDVVVPSDGWSRGRMIVISPAASLATPMLSPAMAGEEEKESTVGLPSAEIGFSSSRFTHEFMCSASRGSMLGLMCDGTHLGGGSAVG